MADDTLTLLMGGDVMLGRGVDQILPHPGDPQLQEPYVHDARRYVDLAEKANGPIGRPVAYSWPWGDAVELVDAIDPDARLINLETSITADGAFAPGKAIHYRMHPDNISSLTAFRPGVCALANNHILDFGHSGLTDTVAALAGVGIPCAGAGIDLRAARMPAVVNTSGGRRVVVGSVASPTSGVPESWAAGHDRPGVSLIPDLSDRDATNDIAAAVLDNKRDADIAVVSVHWGPNWSYAVTAEERQFAHRLIDAGVDVVHGHSSHHPRPIEIYRRRPILYGCGDVIDDYEGIGGHEPFRSHLRLLYVASVDPDSGNLLSLRMIPLRVRRIRLERAGPEETEWLRRTIEHISRRFDLSVTTRPDGLLQVG